MSAIGRLELMVAMVTLALPAAAQQNPEPRWTDDWNWALMAPLLMVLSVVTLIIVVRLAVHLLSRARRSHARQPETVENAPSDALKGQFERGEIDQQKFDERQRAPDH